MLFNLGMEVDEYPGDNPDEDKAGWRLKACKEDVRSERCYATNELKETFRERTKVRFDNYDPTNEVQAEAMKELVDQFDKEQKLKDGNYLRVGRLALIYSDVDGKDVRRFNLEQKREVAKSGDAGATYEPWVQMSGTNQIDLHRAVKMTKGEAAVDVMRVPVEVME